MKINVSVEFAPGDTNPVVAPEEAAQQILAIFDGDISKDSCRVTMNAVPPPPGYVGPPLDPSDPLYTPESAGS